MWTGLISTTQFKLSILSRRLSVVLQEKFRVAVNVQIAVLRFMKKKKPEDVSSSESTVSEAAKARRIQECVDDIGSTVEASVIQQFVGSTIKGQHVNTLKLFILA